MFISYETHQGFKSTGSSTVKGVSYLLVLAIYCKQKYVFFLPQEIEKGKPEEN